MQKLSLNGAWTLDVIGDDGGRLFSGVPAAVPGSVYHDLLTAELIPDPFWRDNETEALRLMEHCFRYARSFEVPEDLLACDRVLLRCEGLDTLADIGINGAPVGSADNMHRTWEFDAKHLLKPGTNEIVVTFRSPTKYIREAYAASRCDAGGCLR